ncbi:MAG: acyloxyacyl hydrolase [Bacteroidales bacterium]|jgi:hypothetical protein|nr:acyloxyacyl hydrolase [Bacteroidales bacterium]
MMPAKRFSQVLLLICLLQGTKISNVAASGNSSMKKEDSVSVQHPKKLFFSIGRQHGSMLNTYQSEVISNIYSGSHFRIGWQTDDSDKNPDDNLYRYPYYGFGYYVGNMNRIVLGSGGQNTQSGQNARSKFGKPLAAYVFFGIPFYRSKWYQATYDISAGFSYNFNAYDPEENPYNLLIGSKNNAYISFSVGNTFTLPGYSTFNAGFSFQHFSNGSYQKPNKGINLVSVTAAYQFGLYANREKHYAQFAAIRSEPVLEWYLSFAGGVRMLDTGFDRNHPHDGKRWFCTTVSSAALVKTGLRRWIGAGLDFFYFDWGRHVIEYRARQEGREATTSPLDNMEWGAFLSHEAGYKRLRMIINCGFYLSDRVGDNPIHPWIYERLGIKYHITKRLFAGLLVKAHLAKADYTEWTFGYILIKDKPLKKR